MLPNLGCLILRNICQFNTKETFILHISMKLVIKEYEHKKIKIIIEIKKTSHKKMYG